MEWNHGILPHAVLPCRKNKERCTRTAEQADDGGAVPCIFITSVLKCQQELDCSRGKEDEAEDIERLEECG